MTEFAIPLEKTEKKLSGHKHETTQKDVEMDGDGGFYYPRDDEYVSAHAVQCVKSRYMKAMKEDPNQIVHLNNGAKGIKGFESVSCLIPGRHCPAVYMWEDIMTLAGKNAPGRDYRNITQGVALKAVREVLQKTSTNFDDLPEVLEQLPVTVSDLTVSEEEEEVVEESTEEDIGGDREMEA